MADVTVTLAHFWTDAKGKEHGPESKVSVEASEARSLIHAGIAQPDKKAEAQAAKEAPKPAAPKADGNA